MTVHIPLTRGFHTVIDKADLPLVQGRRWHVTTPGGGSHEYAVHVRRQPGGGHIHLLMHRIILCAPDGLEVDHLNGNGLDNRRSNLRLVTRSENSRNTTAGRRNTTGVLNVTRHRKLFSVRLWVDGKNLCFGTYPTLAEAAAVAYAARLAHYGPQAVARLPRPPGAKRADEAPSPDRRAVRVLRTSASARVRGGDA